MHPLPEMGRPFFGAAFLLRWHSSHHIGKQPEAIGAKTIPVAAGSEIPVLLHPPFTLLTIIKGVGYNGPTS